MKMLIRSKFCALCLLGVCLCLLCVASLPGCGSRSQEEPAPPAQNNSEDDQTSSLLAASNEEAMEQQLADNPGAWAERFSQPSPEHDYTEIKEAFLTHYLGADGASGAAGANGDMNEALALLPILDNNPSLSAPLLAPFLTGFVEREGTAAAFDWLAQNQDLMGAPHAAATLGDNATREALARNESPSGFFNAVLEGTLKDNVKEAYLLGVIKTWLVEDPKSAFDHLNTIAQGKIPDRIFYQIVLEFSNEYPAPTMAWATLIADTGLRHSAILQTARSWQSHSSESYHEWKNTVELPADLYDELP